MSAAGEPAAARHPATISARPGATDGEWIVHVNGEVDVSTSPQVREELASLIDGGARRIVLDLRETSFIDSAGLGVLVGALKRLREERDGEIVLRGMLDPVRRVFDITGLTNVFTVDDSEA